MAQRIFPFQKSKIIYEQNKLWHGENIRRFNAAIVGSDHGLRTPNEGINQRNLKIWADVADKICFGRT